MFGVDLATTSDTVTSTASPASFMTASFMTSSFTTSLSSSRGGDVIRPRTTADGCEDEDGSGAGAVDLIRHALLPPPATPHHHSTPWKALNNVVENSTYVSTHAVWFSLRLLLSIFDRLRLSKANGYTVRYDDDESRTTFVRQISLVRKRTVVLSLVSAPFTDFHSHSCVLLRQPLPCEIKQEAEILQARPSSGYHGLEWDHITHKIRCSHTSCETYFNLSDKVEKNFLVFGIKIP